MTELNGAASHTMNGHKIDPSVTGPRGTERKGPPPPPGDGGKRGGDAEPSAEPTGQPLLAVRGVETFYGRIIALRGVDVDVHEGEIVTIIGSNGAGKTTLMSTVCGAPRARAGQIIYQGKDITRWPTHQIMHAGIAHSPEGRRIFPRMSVFENLQMGTLLNPDAKETFDTDLQRAYELFPILEKRQNQRGGTLSGGEQQMLAIARALMGRPKLLLLDEPSLGLAPVIVKQIFEVIGELNRSSGLTVFLVEQNAFHALRLAHRGYVMVNGQISLTGTGQELLTRPEVRAAYLEGH
ncbi:MAG: ABC transporter ATP-binding protein [Pseudomonadota bacterium]